MCKAENRGQSPINEQDFQTASIGYTGISGSDPDFYPDF